jgi:hypothetical protein
MSRCAETALIDLAARETIISKRERTRDDEVDHCEAKRDNLGEREDREDVNRGVSAGRSNPRRYATGDIRSFASSRRLEYVRRLR